MPTTLSRPRRHHALDAHRGPADVCPVVAIQPVNPHTSLRPARSSQARLFEMTADLPESFLLVSNFIALLAILGFLITSTYANAMSCFPF